MSAEEANLQLDLRLMAYLDRQLPAEEARQLEADLAADPAQAARLADLKQSFGALDSLMTAVTTDADSRTAPDWRASLNGAMSRFKAESAADIAAAKAKILPLPPRRNRWMHTVSAAAVVAAAAVFLVFAFQSTPFLPLEPQAAPADPFQLPAPLPLTVTPAQADPIRAQRDTVSMESLQKLGLTPLQADRLLRDGVLLVTHSELPAWQAAGLDPHLTVNGQTLPTYLTADAVYNLFLTQMQSAAETFDTQGAADLQALIGGSLKELDALETNPALESTQRPTALRLRAILVTAWDLCGDAKARTVPNGQTGELEIDRIRQAADGTYSPVLLRNVDYAWIRQRPENRARRWLGFVTNQTAQPRDAAHLNACLKLWWSVLQRNPQLWTAYSKLALKTRNEEAGAAQALDLIDLHADFTALCGDNPKLRFQRLMQADLQGYAKPLGILPLSTPFRTALAQQLGAEHSFIDAVLVHPLADTTKFTGAQSRHARLAAYLKLQSPDSPLPRWNRLFESVEQPPAAWPQTTPAWQEKADRLLAAAWVGTPVHPLAVPMLNPNHDGMPDLHYDRFEPAPDFFNRLQTLCAERAATLPAHSPDFERLTQFRKWLRGLTQASLDQLAGRPQQGIDLPLALFPAPADADAAETTCRVAVAIASADAGATDLIMGNGPLHQVLLLQPDRQGKVQVFVGAVSNPLEGMAAHSPAGPEAAWRQLTQDQTLTGFHYNGR